MAAINPVKLLTAANATATNNSTTISLTGDVDASRIFQGSVVVIGGFTPVEAISGTIPDGSGNSTITLRDPWPETTITDRLTAFNTIEGLTGAIEKARQVVEQTSGIEEVSGTGLLEKTGENTYDVAPFTTQGRNLVAGVDAATQRATLGLGDAATKTVTATPTDGTPDRLTKVGDFGLGLRVATKVIDWNTEFDNLGSSLPTLLSNSGSTNGPTTDTFFYPQVISYGIDDNKCVVAWPYRSNNLATPHYRVRFSGSWSDWFQIATSSNDALIEYGSNANGSYTKFPDGTLICTHKLNATSGISIADGAIFQSNSGTWSYPHAFILTPEVNHSIHSGVIGSWVGLGDSSTNITNTSFRAFRATSTATAPSVSLIATGRWK